MWLEGLHCKDKPLNFNDEMLKVEGELELQKAQVTFAKFLKANPSFATSILMGVKLYPIQDIILRAMFQRDFCLNVWSRGFSKSWLCGIFIVLYALFNPRTKIGICSKSFRQARGIFKNIEDLISGPGGTFLKQCIGKVTHNADAWEMMIGSSRIVCIPLGDGAKIRGYRFDVMVIDELLLLSDQVINEVIRPFLVVNTDPQMKQDLKMAKEALVQDGQLTPEDAALIEMPGKKLIGLTSASYKFEYLYKLYDSYIKKILNPINPKEPEEISHFVSQFSYKAAPIGLMNDQQIMEAKASMSAAQFAREIESQFTDDSSGFFSASKLKEATIPDGARPCTKLVGDNDKKYVLSIDPNYNDSESSDHFAMAVTELDETNKGGVLVHCYALAKSNIAARAKYIHYLLTNFNIVFIIVDNAGGTKFISDINESAELKGANINLKFIEDIDFVNGNYADELQEARKQYSPTNGKICYAQVFNTQWIRMANEHLQWSLEKDNKKILFASTPTEIEFLSQLKSRIDIESLEYDSEMPTNKNQKMTEFIEHQSFLIDLTKTECALIEVATNPQGSQTFDLPRSLKSSTAPDKTRKDSYTALLLNNWAIRCYFDITTSEVQKREAFIPISFS